MVCRESGRLGMSLNTHGYDAPGGHGGISSKSYGGGGMGSMSGMGSAGGMGSMSHGRDNHGLGSNYKKPEYAIAG